MGTEFFHQCPSALTTVSELKVSDSARKELGIHHFVLTGNKPNTLKVNSSWSYKRGEDTGQTVVPKDREKGRQIQGVIAYQIRGS